MEFWFGFYLAYSLAGGLVFRLIRETHKAVHPDEQRGVGEDVYVFFVWPAVLTRLADGDL